MSEKRRRSYAWVHRLAADDPRRARLSEVASNGLAWADDLAEQAQERSKRALLGKPPPTRTVTTIAAEERMSPSTIYRALKQLRIELFGKDLSDSAIYYRLRHPRPERPCAEPRCNRTIGGDAPANRRYCNTHNAPHARVRRHRRNKAQRHWHQQKDATASNE